MWSTLPQGQHNLGFHMWYEGDQHPTREQARDKGGDIMEQRH